MINNIKVINIVNNKSFYIIILKLCIRKLNLKPDKKIKFSINFAINFIKKIRKLFYKLEIIIDNIQVTLLVILLKIL